MRAHLVVLHVSRAPEAKSLPISYLRVCVWCECGVGELCASKLYLIKKNHKVPYLIFFCYHFMHP
jgi:hypothetical protein